MNRLDDTKAKDALRAARESFSGRLLTNPQFEEATAITRIIEREIHNSGSFKEKLGDYAHAFARSERFDAVKADTILRDIFKERTGQTMNALRESLAEREKEVTDKDRVRALEAAYGIGAMIERGPMISLRRAYAHQAEELAETLGITDGAAKTLMKDEFKAAERAELFDWGKEIEERYFRPHVEAEQRRREQASSARDDHREPQRSDAPRRSDAPPRRDTSRSDAPRRYRTGPSGP